MTKIEYLDATWNPVTGCTKVSMGCTNCWAERMSRRLAGRCGYPADDPFRVTFHPDRLDWPIRRRKPLRIGVCFMGDLFHEDVPDWEIAKIFAVMALAQHTFQILTKRSKRMAAWVGGKGHDDTEYAASLYANDWGAHVAAEALGGGWVDGQYDCDGRCELPPAYEDLKISWPLPNVWFGTSIEDQNHLDRIRDLRRVPAAMRFLSLEPLLGAIPILPLDGIDWVIVGGESGPGARPCHVEWIASIRDQCQAAGTPIFIKQMGSNSIWSEVVSRGAYEHWHERWRIFHDAKGGDPSEWPENLRVREYPVIAAGSA